MLSCIVMKWSKTSHRQKGGPISGNYNTGVVISGSTAWIIVCYIDNITQPHIWTNFLTAFEAMVGLQVRRFQCYEKYHLSPWHLQRHQRWLQRWPHPDNGLYNMHKAVHCRQSSRYQRQNNWNSERIQILSSILMSFILSKRKPNQIIQQNQTKTG